MKRRELNHQEVFIFEILVHVFVLITILCVFFFTIVSSTERKALDREVKEIIEKGIDNATWPLNPALGENLILASSLFDGQSMEDFNYNLALTYACIALLVGLLVAMICIWATIKMITTKKFPFLSILYRNILLFGVIGCIEYVFFMEVAIKYVPVLPSYAEDILREDLR